MVQQPCSNNKTHVQIMKLTCCLNMDFELLISQDRPCFVYVRLRDVTLSPWTYILEFYDDVRGHCATGVIVNNILNQPPCRILRVSMEFLWRFGAFSSQFAIGIVSYARTTIIHGYFTAITFADYRKIFEQSA